MNPYLPIRKVPLDYNGIESSAYSVQMQHTADTMPIWKETGVVGHNYLLVDNDSVRKAANQVAEECNLSFTHDKTFFNGRSYAYSMISDHVAGEVAQGDDVALGMQFWNSYDGSKAFGFAMMLYRLVCTNGMISKDHFNTYRFKHQPANENWEESLEQVVTNINNLVNGKDMKRRGVLEEFLKNLRSLDNLEVTTSELGRSRIKTAIGVKGAKKVSKLKVSKAKQKGALKAFETARVKEDKVFIKTLQTFTGASKKPHFKTFWKKLDKPIKW